MQWIKISEKIPPLNKPFFGLVKGENEYKPCIFCRRGTKKEPIFQGYWDLYFYDVQYWLKIELPEFNNLIERL